MHVIPDPRGYGNSEGLPAGRYGAGITDIYDVTDWIAKQPWCDGNIGMMGACAFAGYQMRAAIKPHPNLRAINPFEMLGSYVNNEFHGIFDCATLHVLIGRHGNDRSITPNREC